MGLDVRFRLIAVAWFWSANDRYRQHRSSGSSQDGRAVQNTMRPFNGVATEDV